MLTSEQERSRRQEVLLENVTRRAEEAEAKCKELMGGAADRGVDDLGDSESSRGVDETAVWEEKMRCVLGFGPQNLINP